MVTTKVQKHLELHREEFQAVVDAAIRAFEQDDAYTFEVLEAAAKINRRRIDTQAAKAAVPA